MAGVKYRMNMANDLTVMMSDRTLLTIDPIRTTLIMLPLKVGRFD